MSSGRRPAIAGLAVLVLFLSGCVTPNPVPAPMPGPEPAPRPVVRQGITQSESDEVGVRGLVADVVPPEDVDVVEPATFNEEDLRCYLVRWPASRMVVGEECVLVENQTGSSSFDPNDPFFDPLEWEREILAPGVYRMTRKR